VPPKEAKWRVQIRSCEEVFSPMLLQTEETALKFCAGGGRGSSLRQKRGGRQSGGVKKVMLGERKPLLDFRGEKTKEGEKVARKKGGKDD